MAIKSILGLGSMAALASGHAIFQELSVEGVNQGVLKGIRAPDDNSPVQDVTSPNMACNVGINHRDEALISIPAGAEVGAFWGHVIGGEQFPNDPDNPIAVSHKGPIIAYLAKVDDAVSAEPEGLEWFKIAESGLDNGVWAVDDMNNSGGWSYFSVPSCVAPGQYLLRVELIALHSASIPGEAQFYMECAQVEITGSGSSQGGETVSFPGAYSAQDPGVLISIYSEGGIPDNNGQPYQIPGPAVLTC